MKTERVEWQVQWRRKVVTGKECFPCGSPKKSEIEARIELRHVSNLNRNGLETRIIKRTVIEEVVE